MSNQINHRGPKNKRNARRDERATWASGCSGEGHNGQKGRSKWKKLSRRNERRALKENRTPRIKKYIKKSFDTTPRTRPDFTGDGGQENRTVIGQCSTPRPLNSDTGEDEY